MTRDEAMSKVAKLLKLGASTNENEATQAVALAQRLMAEFAIDDAMLASESAPEEPIRNWEDPLFGEEVKSKSTWRTHLAAVIASANSCATWLRGGSIRIVGRASDANAVRYLFAFCNREIDRLAAQYSGNGKTWLNNYRLGIVDTIRRKLGEATRSVQIEARASHGVAADRAIVRIDERAMAVKDFMKTKLRLKKYVEVKSRSDLDARAQGQLDGRAINVGSGPGLGAGTRGEIE